MFRLFSGMLLIAPLSVSAAAQVAPIPESTFNASRPTSLDTLTNSTVIELVRAGLGSESIIAKINASNGTYDTSTDALIQMKQAGVQDGVIAAMLQRSTTPVLINAVADIPVQTH